MSLTPLRLYLDTSDFSRFADIGYHDEPGMREILDFLIDKRTEGLIEIRFSWVHLFEFLKDPNQRVLALRKVRVIEELCGDQTFGFFDIVFTREREAFGSASNLRQLVAPRVPPASRPWRSDGFRRSLAQLAQRC
jgi:hypothetical protein